MARLLLDTNVLIPAVDDQLGALPAPIRDAMMETRNQLFVSVASLWEIAIKARMGKVVMATPLNGLPAQLGASGIGILDLEPAHVLTEAQPVPDTKDPFDRLLLAVATVESAQLVTTDRKLVGHPAAWKPGLA